MASAEICRNEIEGGIKSAAIGMKNQEKFQEMGSCCALIFIPPSFKPPLPSNYSRLINGRNLKGQVFSDNHMLTVLILWNNEEFRRYTHSRLRMTVVIWGKSRQRGLRWRGRAWRLRILGGGLAVPILVTFKVTFWFHDSLGMLLSFSEAVLKDFKTYFVGKILIVGPCGVHFSIDLCHLAPATTAHRILRRQKYYMD